jgi:hypothetical protein
MSSNKNSPKIVLDEIYPLPIPLPPPPITRKKKKPPIPPQYTIKSIDEKHNEIMSQFGEMDETQIPEWKKRYQILKKKIHYYVPEWDGKMGVSVFALENHKLQEKVYAWKEEMDKIRGDKFGNGRTVRNLYERTIRNVASRVIKTMPSNIKLVLPEDVSMIDVNLVLRKNQMIPIRSAELVSTEENEFVSSRDENTHTNEEVSPYKFFSQLGEMLVIFANQQINTEEINTIEEMQCFTRHQIGKQEVFLPLINEIIRILVILENQGLEQNQDARKQLMDERIVPIFNEKSIKIADFFINGYLKKTQI